MTEMPQLEQKKNAIIRLNPFSILWSALVYIRANWLFCLSVFVANLAYILLFKSIPHGMTNPLSLLWLAGYYVFWCAFYRYYYQLRPYFFVKAITGSLTPSTKGVLFLFLGLVLIVYLPMFPLLLGYNDIYLDLYERYVQIFESLADADRIRAASWDVFICYGIVALLSPPLICRPYMAYIASLQRQNVSFTQAGNKMRGNYWALVFISAVLLFAEAAAEQLDRLFKLQDWLSFSLGSFIFVYMNLVFAKLYDFFYVKH